MLNVFIAVWTDSDEQPAGSDELWADDEATSTLPETALPRRCPAWVPTPPRCITTPTPRRPTSSSPACPSSPWRSWRSGWRGSTTWPASHDARWDREEWGRGLPER